MARKPTGRLAKITEQKSQAYEKLTGAISS